MTAAFSDAFVDTLESHLTYGRARWETPGAMAKALEPRTVQTQALELIDQHLVELAGTPDGRLIVMMPPQEGKALALDTPIATPTGWTTMGELQVGDQVFDRHGDPCAVTWISPTWTDRDCYEVTTGDGERIVADAAHEWVAKLDRRCHEHVVDTTVLARTRGKNAQIVSHAGLELPDADLPLDPYVLGAWLGDGHTTAAMLTSADPEIPERIRAAGIPCRKMSSGPYAWSMAPEGASTKCSPIRRTLVDLGVWGNKHIPTAYLRASFRQRLALLQGLVDTDGHVTLKGQVEFCSTTQVLAEQVRELVYTLGGKAVLTEGRATIEGRDVGPRYRVRFYLAKAAHLPRKAARCKDSSVGRIRYVTAARTESVPTRCIEVDSPDHTYLAGRTMLPTHNSQRVTRRFPEWMLAEKPDTRIAIVSYEAKVARRFGRVIRDDLREHANTIGLRIRDDLSAQSEWQLRGYEGGVVTVGIGGGLTGRAVDLLIIDDPIKDRAQADSPTYRDRAFDWWTDVGSTRLAPGAPVALVLTRWHDDDLAGRLLAAEDGHTWKVLRIPAQADHDPNAPDADVEAGRLTRDDPLGRAPGEYLESARGRTRKQWDGIRIRAGSRTWQSLYQGRPSSAEGDIFKRVDWQEYDVPQWLDRDDGSRLALGFDEVLASWDMTFKDTKGTDYVVGQVWGRRGAEAYLLDQVRGRWDFTETLKQFERLAARWPEALLKLVEDKANGPAVIASLKRKVPGIVPIEPHGSKVARASAVSPLVEAHNVWLPSPELAPWVGDLIEEAAGFPTAAHDDQVDALTQGLHRLILEPLLAEGDGEVEVLPEYDVVDRRGWYASPI